MPVRQKTLWVIEWFYQAFTNSYIPTSLGKEKNLLPHILKYRWNLNDKCAMFIILHISRYVLLFLQKYVKKIKAATQHWNSKCPGSWVISNSDTIIHANINILFTFICTPCPKSDLVYYSFAIIKFLFNMTKSISLIPPK